MRWPEVDPVQGMVALSVDRGLADLVSGRGAVNWRPGRDGFGGSHVEGVDYVV
jgi:hypothetical protein